VTPFVYEADMISTVASLTCGLLLIGLSVPRGTIHNGYGKWDRFIV